MNENAGEYYQLWNERYQQNMFDINDAYSDANATVDEENENKPLPSPYKQQKKVDISMKLQALKQRRENKAELVTYIFNAIRNEPKKFTP